MVGGIAFPGPMDRPRLTGFSALLATRRLALVHAPAGYGKTTLLSQWRAALLQSGVKVAWLSIGPDDVDPISPAAHLVPAIQAACGLEGTSRGAYSAEDAMSSLRELIEVACRLKPLAVMIDDYHLAQQPAGRQAVAALLASRNPALVVVIASRGRPDLSLGRLRANDELIDIGHDELRFSASEMDRFFTSIGGIPLTEAQTLFVQQRTEGWAAGLRLMSLALKRTAERDAILAGTPGSQRDFADYFLEEVLDGLDDRLIRFLLMVSVLEELQADLCEAVTGERDASRLLDELERGNLFTTTLPGRPGWYRFHHLFLEFLRARLVLEPRHDAGRLHRRAAEWFVEASRPMEAVRHAFLSQNPERAAELIERYCVFDYLSFGRFDVYHRWMRQLPGAVLAARPLLSFLLTWRYINGRRFAQAEQVLSGIEASCLDPTGLPTAPVAATGLKIEGRLHLMRALIGAYGADLNACRRHIEAIGTRSLDDFAFGQVDRDSIHGYLAFQLGDLEAAQRLTWKAFRRYQDIDCHWGAMHSQCIAAMAFMAAGQMREAQTILTEAVETGAAVFPEHSYPVALPCGLLGALLFEIGAFEEAERLLLQAAAGDMHSNTFGLAERVITPTIALAQLYDATGRTEHGDTLLVRASRLAYQAEDLRLDFQFAVERADRALRLRRFGDAATELVRVRSQIDQMRTRFPAEAWAIWQPHAILEARWIAQTGQAQAAVKRLRALAAVATSQERHGHAAAIEALTAAIGAASAPLHASGPMAAARQKAGGQGLVRSLPDIGIGLIDVRRSALWSGGGRAPMPAAERPWSAPFGLTRREEAVLACLSDGLNNGEIARRLAINVNTVKTHLKSVFSKLDVRSRSQALLLVQDLRGSADG